eukprot:scaffold90233_cov32-Tisochrysis_lutea.AAC.2
MQEALPNRQRCDYTFVGLRNVRRHLLMAEKQSAKSFMVPSRGRNPPFSCGQHALAFHLLPRGEEQRFDRRHRGPA